MMKLIELEQEVYDPALMSHQTQPQMELRTRKELGKLSDIPEIDRDDLTALILAESYMVAKGDDSQLAVVWKSWDELSRPPFDVVNVTGARMRIPWDYYGQTFNEIGDYLRFDMQNPTEIKSGEGWPFNGGWQMSVRRSSRFPDLKLFVIHSCFGLMSPVDKDKYLGVTHLPLRSVSVVTNSPTPFTLVV